MTKQPTPAVRSPVQTKLSAALPLFIAQAAINVGLLERLLSLVVGMTIVLLAIRRFLLSAGLIVAGLYFLYRGLTGYCPLYGSEAIDTRHQQWQLPAFSNLRKALTLPPQVTIWRQPSARSTNRSENHEQDNSTRQMAPIAWQP